MGKRFLYWLCGILILFLILFFLTPTILSSGWGNRLILSTMSRHLPGDATAEKISVRWLGPQEIDQLTYHTSDGSQTLTVKKITVSRSLWALMWGTYDYGEVDLLEPRLTLTAPSLSRSHSHSRSHPFLFSGSPHLQFTFVPDVPAGTFRIIDGFAKAGGQRLTIPALTLSHPRRFEQLVVKGSGTSTEGTWMVDLEVERFHLEHLITPTPEGVLTLAPGIKIRGVAEAKKFPVVFIDLFTAYPVRELVGDLADFDFHIKGSGEAATASLLVAAPRLNADLRLTSEGGEVRLAQPGKVDLTLYPEAAAQIPQLKGLDLQAPARFDLSIDRFDALIAARPQRFEKLAFDASARLGATRVGLLLITAGEASASLEALGKPLHLKGSLSAPPSSFTGDATFLDGALQQIDVKAVDFPLSWLDESLAPLVGERLTGTLAYDGNSATVAASSSQLDIPATTFTLGKQITLSAPAKWTYRLSPALFSELLEVIEPVTLSEPATLQIEISKLSLPRWSADKPYPWRQGSGSGVITSENLQIDGIPSQGKALVERMQLAVEAERLDAGKLRFYSSTSFPDKGGTVAQFLQSDLPIDIDGSYKIGKEGQFTIPRCHFMTEAEDFSLQFIGTYQNDEFKIISPLTVQYVFTQELINRLYPGHPNLLAKPFQVTATVNAGQLEVGEIAPSTLKLVGEAEVSEIILKDGSRLSNLQGDFTIDRPNEKSSFTFTGKSHVGGESGPLKFTLQTDGDHLTTNLSLQPLPVEAVMLFAGTDKRADQAKALLGKKAHLEASATLQGGDGSLNLALNSDNTLASLDGRITDKTLTLSTPLSASLTITPDVAQHLLIDVNPLLVTALRSEQPVTLVVEPQGFALPLFPTLASGLQFQKATLNLGKLWMQNTGPVRDLFKMFKRSQLNEQKEILVWATPVYFSCNSGVLNYQRADMVIGTSLQVAFWGTANLHTNALNMRLAVPGYSLRKILGVGDVPDDYYLVIPMRGTIQESKIDYSAAVPQIAALLARKEGETGKAVGSIISVLSGGLKKQDVPPPTTQPFPWANDPTYRFPSQTEPAPSPTPSGKDIQKKVEKEAGRQLKKLFN